jgi:mono/diheme cytochrome c family protein
MILRVMVVALIWGAFLCSLPLAEEKTADRPGKDAFSRCAACHGDSGEGKDAIAKMLGVKMPQLYSKEIQSMDNAALRKVILEGKGKMPPVANLTDQQISDVIAYLRSLSKKKQGKV